MRSRTIWSVAWQAAAVLGASVRRPRDAAAAECSALAATAVLPDQSRVLNATHVPAHALNVTGVLNAVPLCRVAGETTYAGGNHSVLFEVWLPDAEAYNGRFMVVGNGGMAGTIDQVSLMKNLNSGYAVAGGDAGHRASDNNNGSGAPGVYLPYMHDPAQVEAWIHNSIAYFTPAAKGLAAAFYGAPARGSYYVGCSTGGAQGFALAQYHPELFDGIVAGCPGNWYSHLALSFLWNAQKSQGSAKLPQTALDLITQTAIAQCDELDGVADGVIENPLACALDVGTLACDASSSSSSSTAGNNDTSSSCLTAEQVAAARAIYAGPVDARTGAALYPGFAPGSEAEWAKQQGDLADSFSVPILQNMVFDDLAYDPAAFDWAADVDALDARVGRHIDAVSPDLSAFRAAGGKMLVLQSWADPYNAPTWPQQHLRQIEAAMGKGEEGNDTDVGDWIRLFMVPGGGHCAAAAHYPQVPAEWHTVEGLVPWVEEGVAPAALRSTNPPDGSRRSRKLCPWPQTARYLGGDSDDWRSYECAA